MRNYPEIWFHIDAAWLGAAFSCPELRERCRVPAINKFADSLCVNFHKVQNRLPLYPFDPSKRCTVGAGQLGMLRSMGQRQEESDRGTGRYTSLPEKHRGGCRFVTFSFLCPEMAH